MATRKTAAKPKAKEFFIGVDYYGNFLSEGDIEAPSSSYFFSSTTKLMERYEEAVADGDWTGHILVAKIVSGHEVVKSISDESVESIIMELE